jgi:hypothetical protein
MRVEELVTMPDASGLGFAVVLEDDRLISSDGLILVIARQGYRIPLDPTGARMLAAVLVQGADEAERRKR